VICPSGAVDHFRHSGARLFGGIERGKLLAEELGKGVAGNHPQSLEDVTRKFNAALVLPLVDLVTHLLRNQIGKVGFPINLNLLHQCGW
jgi:hypothetical protein